MYYELNISCPQKIDKVSPVRGRVEECGAVCFVYVASSSKQDGQRLWKELPGVENVAKVRRCDGYDPLALSDEDLTGNTQVFQTPDRTSFYTIRSLVLSSL